MIEIHNLLSLKSNSPKEEIKSKYYKRMFQVHPNNKNTGNKEEYEVLQESYKRFVLGLGNLNCYRICTNEETSIDCRCGGSYYIMEGYVGRIDCDFCSCFIEVEDPPLMLN